VTEFKLIVQLGSFLLLYQVLTGLVRLYGPFHTRSYVRFIQGLAGVLAGLGGRIAATVPQQPPASVQTAHGE
jgi:hypothetical protein